MMRRFIVILRWWRRRIFGFSKKDHEKFAAPILPKEPLYTKERHEARLVAIKDVLRASQKNETKEEL